MQHSLYGKIGWSSNYHNYCFSQLLLEMSVGKVRNFTNHRHIEDVISVNKIVEELKMETPSPVLHTLPTSRNY